MKSPTFVEMHNHPGFLIRLAYQIYNASWEQVMTETDLSPQPFALLYTVYFHDGIDVSGLALKTGVDRASVSRILTRLSNEGYLRVFVRNSDKRQKEIFITAKGKKVFNKAVPQLADLGEQLLKCFTKANGEQFVKLLEEFVYSNNDVTRAPIELPEDASH